MRWKGGRRSQNVEDRRGTRMGRGAAVGGVGGLGFLVIVVLYMLLGGDPAQLVEQMPQAGSIPFTMYATACWMCWRHIFQCLLPAFIRRKPPISAGKPAMFL